MNMKNKFYLWGIILLVGFLSFLYISGSNTFNTTTQNTSTNDTQTNLSSSTDPFKPSEDTIDVTMDILNALNYYYYATQEPVDEGSDFIKIMTSLLNQNKHLETGNKMIKGHLNNSNEVIELATKGMTAGADQVIKANNEIVQNIRNLDPNNSRAAQELEYSIAKYISDQKEGFRMITLAAPQIAYLIFEPAKTETPSGKIPYRITKEERTRILNEIDRLFGEDLKRYPKGYDAQAKNYNSILVAVDAIQKNLIPETYEEAKRYE